MFKKNIILIFGLSFSIQISTSEVGMSALETARCDVDYMEKLYNALIDANPLMIDKEVSSVLSSKLSNLRKLKDAIDRLTIQNNELIKKLGTKPIEPAMLKKSLYWVSQLGAATLAIAPLIYYLYKKPKNVTEQIDSEINNIPTSRWNKFKKLLYNNRFEIGCLGVSIAGLITAIYTNKHNKTAKLIFDKAKSNYDLNFAAINLNKGKISEMQKILGTNSWQSKKILNIYSKIDQIITSMLPFCRNYLEQILLNLRNISENKATLLSSEQNLNDFLDKVNKGFL